MEDNKVICPYCCRLVSITKNGVIMAHGHKKEVVRFIGTHPTYYRLGKIYRKIKQTRGYCSGYGIKIKGDNNDKLQ